MYEYRGNLHIHSTYSDGTGTVEQIAAAANRAGLDFIVLTDHNTFAPLREGKQGWYGETLVLFGQEINDQHNHYLAFGLTDEVPCDDAHPQNVIDGVHARGGFGFIAHPDDVGTPLDSGGHSFTWTDWSVQGYEGIEIWNFSSHWKAPVQSLLSGLWRYYFDFDSHAATPPAETVARWHRACLTRRVVAIGTSDAHDLPVRAGPLTLRIFPYEMLFRRLTMHLWTPERLSGERSQAGIERDRKLLFDALREGHGFISDRGAGDASSSVILMQGRERSVIPGDEIVFEPGMELGVRLPGKAEICILKDGQIVRRQRASRLDWVIDGPGVFVVQAILPHRVFGERTWIFSNPVYVRPSEDARKLARGESLARA